eukprot:gene2667-2912_t
MSLKEEAEGNDSLSERAANHLRFLGLPLYDVQGLMRHVLDCLGTLKVRLEDEGDAHVEPHLLTVFCDGVKLFIDHFSGLEPIDEESGIKYLLQAFPDDSKRKDGRSWLPLHLAAAIHHTDPIVMNKLVEERPVQLIKGHLHDENQLDNYNNNNNNNNNHDGSGEVDIFGQVPSVTKGLCPLHLIASLRHPHLSSINKMISTCPKALAIADHRGYMPLHYCAYNTRSLEACHLILQSYPQAAFESNSKGKLPFQLSAWNKYTLIMDILLDVNPAAIDTIDYHGNTPLHDASKALNYEGVKKLLAIKPALNRVRNFNESLPIHKCFHYIEKGFKRLHFRQMETVKAILQVNPEVAALQDENNMLPLHLAVFFKAAAEVVDYIYNIYPSGALVKDRYGNFPVQYVTDDEEVKKLLMKTAKPLARVGITDSFSRFTLS